jgi:hypothetical protein
MESNSFQYKDAIQIGYRSCKFDSLLELKFTLSIEDNWYFLREHIVIYYDPKTFLPTNYIRDTTRKYTPDFLIRNNENNKAFLIELKPRAFRNEIQTMLRKQVAENYIKSKKLDWIYKVVYDDEIILSREQQEKFSSLRAGINAFNFKWHFDNLDKKWNITKRNYFKTIPGGRKGINPAVYAKLVKYGMNLGN